MRKIVLLIILLLKVNLNLLAQVNVSLLSQLSYPGLSFSGFWHYVDNSFNEYALAGASDGMRIYDITNPASPQLVASVPGQASIWREVKTYGHYAYVTTEAGTGVAGVNDGLQIIDLAGLPNSVSYKFYSDSLLGSLLLRAHTVTVSDNGYMYVNGTHLANGAVGGVLVFDLADPWNPVFVGNYINNYVHDCIVYNDTMISSELGQGFAIVDMSNKASPVVLQTQPTPGNFNHNTWRSDNGKVLFTTDEVGGAPLGAYDISDIANIKLLDTYFTENIPAAEVHNVRVLNDFLICPSYGSQMTIVDAARPDNLIEIGSYPTSGNLCWDADPYFPSGNIIAGDMDGNFYVLSANFIRACYLEGIVTDSITGLPLANASVQVSIVNLQQNTNVTGQYKTGTKTPGTYTVSVIATGYATKSFSNVVLTNGVLTTLDVQLVPLGTGINHDEEQKINVFPNPATENVYFTVPGSGDDINIRIVNITGSEVALLKSNYDRVIFNCRNTEKGIYFYEVIKNGKAIQHGKLILQ